MGNFSILKSKSFWFTVAGAVAHVVFSPPSERAQAAVVGISAIGAAAGFRGAIAKNGENR